MSFLDLWQQNRKFGLLREKGKERERERERGKEREREREMLSWVIVGFRLLSSTLAPTHCFQNNRPKTTKLCGSIITSDYKVLLEG